MAPEPIAVAFERLVSATSAPSPRAELADPVLLDLNESRPTDVLNCPVVFDPDDSGPMAVLPFAVAWRSANLPMAVLPFPTLLADRASCPRALLLSPVVFSYKAPVPTPTL